MSALLLRTDNSQKRLIKGVTMYYYEWYWLEWLDLNKHIISLDVVISKRCNLSVKNIRNSNCRHTNRRIIQRVTNALDALVKSGVIIEWHYTHSKRAQLTDEEKRACKEKIPYNVFIKLYIKFQMPNDLYFFLKPY